MTDARRQLVIGATLVVLLLGQAGCALHTRPPSEQARAEFGTIGVVSARFTPKAEFPVPARGAAGGTGRGAAVGALRGVAVVSEAGRGCQGYACGVFLLAMPVGAFFGAVIGGVHGGVTAESAEAVEKAEAALRTAVAGLSVQEAVRERVVEFTEAGKIPFALALVDEYGPTTPEEKVSYRALAQEGIATVLELSVLSFGLTGEWGVNPPLAQFMTVRTRVVRSLDDKEVYARTFRYPPAPHERSPAMFAEWRKFTEWAADEAMPFLEGLDLTNQTLAARIVEEVFFARREEPDKRKDEPRTDFATQEPPAPSGHGR